MPGSEAFARAVRTVAHARAAAVITTARRRDNSRPIFASAHSLPIWAVRALLFCPPIHRSCRRIIFSALRRTALAPSRARPRVNAIAFHQSREQPDEPLLVGRRE